MIKGKRVFTRRDFLRSTAFTTAAVVLGTHIEAEGNPNPERRSRVVLVRHPDALDKNHNPNAKVIQHMLDEGIKTLLGIEDTVDAWRQLIQPNDLVGIKSNVWGLLPTPREVEDAIRRRIIDAGVPGNRIRMDDRGARK